MSQECQTQKTFALGSITMQRFSSLRVEKDLLPSGVKESRRLKWTGMSLGRLDLYYEVEAKDRGRIYLVSMFQYKHLPLKMPTFLCSYQKC